MKKYIFVLNPDNFVYSFAVFTFLSKYSDRIDSICIFPAKGKWKSRASYTLTLVRLMGWKKFFSEYLTWEMKAFFAKLLFHGEKHSISLAGKFHNIPVFHFDDVNSQEFIEHAQHRKPQAILNICSQIYRKSTIQALPPIYNFHGGYLPGNRGRFPVFWAIVKDLPHFITCHHISEKIDGGEPLYHFKLDTNPADGVFEILMKIINAFPKVVEKSINLIDEGKTKTIEISFPDFYGKQPTLQEVKNYYSILQNRRKN